MGGSIFSIEYHPDTTTPVQPGDDHLVIPALEGGGSFVLIQFRDHEREALIQRYLKSNNRGEFTNEELDRIIWPGGKPPGK